MEIVTTLRCATTVVKANGEVQSHEEVTVCQRIVQILKVFEDTSLVFPLGKFCDEHGNSHEWINGHKKHLIKNGIRIRCNTENFVPIVVPDLSSSSSSTFSSSTTMISSRQEIDHPRSSSCSSAPPSMTSSTVSSESVARQERGDPCGWITIPQSYKVNVWKDETRTLLKL